MIQLGSELRAVSTPAGVSMTGPKPYTRESKMAVDLSMSVLVVDDYNTMIHIIRNLLKQLGSRTSTMPATGPRP